MAKKKQEFRATKSIKISPKEPTELNDLVSFEGNQENNIVFDIAVNASWEGVVENYKNLKYPVSPHDIANYLDSMESLYLSGQLKYKSVTKIDERLVVVEERIGILLGLLINVNDAINSTNNSDTHPIVSELYVRLRYIKAGIKDIDAYVFDKIHSHSDSVDHYDCYLYILQQIRKYYELQVKYFKSLYGSIKNSKHIRRANNSIRFLSLALTQINKSKISKIKDIEKEYGHMLQLENYKPTTKKQLQEHLKKIIIINKLEFAELMEKELQMVLTHLDIILNMCICPDEYTKSVIDRFKSNQVITGKDLYKKNRINKIVSDISPVFAKIQCIERINTWLYQNKIQPIFMGQSTRHDICLLDTDAALEVSKEELDMILNPEPKLESLYGEKVDKITRLIKHEQKIWSTFQKTPDNLFIESMVYTAVKEISTSNGDIDVDIEQIRYIIFGVTKVMNNLPWNVIDNTYKSNTCRDFSKLSLTLIRKINKALLISAGIEDSEIHLSDSTLMHGPIGLIEVCFCPHYLENGMFLVIARDPVRKLITGMKLIPGNSYDGFATVDMITELSLESKKSFGISTDSSSATRFCLGLMKLANLSFFLCNVKCKTKQNVRKFSDDEIDFIKKLIQLIRINAITVPYLIKINKMRYNGRIYDVREIVENIGATSVNFMLSVYSKKNEGEFEKKIKYCMNSLFAIRESINNTIKNVFKFALIDSKSFYVSELLVEILRLMINVVVLDARKNKYQLSYSSVKSVAFDKDHFEEVIKVLKPSIADIIQDISNRKDGELSILEIKSILAQYDITRDDRTLENILNDMGFVYVKKQELWITKSKQGDLLKQDLLCISNKFDCTIKSGDIKNVNELWDEISSSLVTITQKEFRKLYKQRFPYNYKSKSHYYA